MSTPLTMALSELAAKTGDADFIKQSLQFSLQRLMEMDVESKCKAGYGERSDERMNPVGQVKFLHLWPGQIPPGGTAPIVG